MTGSHIDTIPASDPGRWMEILAQTDGYDFYHLPAYHVINQEGAGRDGGFLFVYREGSSLAAWPFLLRSLCGIEGLNGVADGVRDATSVYGYPGPVCTANVRRRADFIRRFGIALHHTAKDLHLVSLFSRTHPLLNNAVLSTDIGTVVPMGETVSLDLTETESGQWSHIRRSHRSGIKKAQRLGITAVHDRSWEAFDDFIDAYTATMEHVGASPRYFFDREYFLQLRQALGDRLHLFVAQYQGVTFSGSLFVHTGEIIQFHLSGSNPEFRKFATTKLVINAARLWGKAVGARYLHLGGGVGASADSLFHFKAGFSPARHRFHVWRHIVDTELYANLVEARRFWLLKNGAMPANNSYFPLYRAEAWLQTARV